MIFNEICPQIGKIDFDEKMLEINLDAIYLD